MWHLTLDTWHVTRDKWHLLRYAQGVMNIVSKFQVPSSYGLGVKVSWRFWTKGSLNELISDGGDCRTASATPGLLINRNIFFLRGMWNFVEKTDYDTKLFRRMISILLIITQLILTVFIEQLLALLGLLKTKTNMTKPRCHKIII